MGPAMALTTQSVLSDLDATLPQATDAWRSTALRQIVELFVSGATPTAASSSRCSTR